MKSKNKKNECIRKGQFCGWATKEVRFFYHFKYLFEGQRTEKGKNKKKTLNPKPYIPLSHISLGAKNT
jgi:hypothetical protein